MTNRAEASPIQERANRCAVAHCREQAAGVLVYDNGGRFRRPVFHHHYEYPLCEAHSDPKFHLRPLDSPAWNWKPTP